MFITNNMRTRARARAHTHPETQHYISSLCESWNHSETRKKIYATSPTR